MFADLDEKGDFQQGNADRQNRDYDAHACPIFHGSLSKGCRQVPAAAKDLFAGRQGGTALAAAMHVRMHASCFK
jgi:hypothetical protein